MTERFSTFPLVSDKYLFILCLGLMITFYIKTNAIKAIKLDEKAIIRFHKIVIVLMSCLANSDKIFFLVDENLSEKMYQDHFMSTVFNNLQDKKKSTLLERFPSFLFI